MAADVGIVTIAISVCARGIMSQPSVTDTRGLLPWNLVSNSGSSYLIVLDNTEAIYQH